MSDIVKEMKKINSIFKKHNIRLWLNWGTLLGAVRDKKLIDDDIDLSTIDLNHSSNKKDRDKILKALKKDYIIEEHHLGFNVSKDKFRAGIGFYKIGKIPDKPNVLYQENIPVLYQNKFFAKKFYYGFMRNNPTNFKYLFFKMLGGCYITHLVPSDMICPLKEITFYDNTFNIPYDSECYLEYLYGKDWRIPNPNFPHFINKKNVKQFKGTFNTIMVECPKCGHYFSEKKTDQEYTIVVKKFMCPKCGKKWYQRVFVKGIVQWRIK